MKVKQCQTQFHRPYIKGDIQLRKYCSGGVGYLKTRGEANKHQLFNECLNIESFMSNFFIFQKVILTGGFFLFPPLRFCLPPENTI